MKVKKFLRAAAPIVALGIAVGGCSSSDPDGPVPSPAKFKDEKDISDDLGHELSTDEVIAAIFAGADPGTLSSGDRIERQRAMDIVSFEPMAKVSGEVPNGGNKVMPVTAQFDTVEAYPDRTVLRYSLRSSDGETYLVNSQTPLASSIYYMDRIRLIDDAIEQVRFNPLTASREEKSDRCICSPWTSNINQNDQWHFSVYPPLDPQVTAVKVEIPYLEPTEVPVEWVTDKVQVAD